MILLTSQELSVLGFRDPTAAQAYNWPYVSSGRDVLFVSPPLSGKTLAYLLPLLTTISASTPRDSSEKYSGVCLLRCSMYHYKICYGQFLSAKMYIVAVDYWLVTFLPLCN